MIAAQKDWSKFQHQRPASSRRTEVETQSSDSELCGEFPLFEPFWKLPLEQRSRLNEDKIIFNTFFSHLSLADMKNFRYLELGAFNGVGESNTRFFDVCLGWEGLLIEPNPRVFPQLVENRPNAHRMSYAASCSEEEEAANKTVGFWASAFTNAAQDESVNRGAYAGDASRFTQVPCGSLTPVLLDLFPGGRVHFFSLDTEGTEHFILQNIDFSRLVFDVLIAESQNEFCKDECEAREKTRAIMKAAGYILYPKTVPRSDLYVHPQSEFAKMIS